MANWHPKRICRFPGCHQTTPDKYCQKHPNGPPRKKEINRPNSAARGYDHQWRQERAVFLSKYPLCVHCLQHNRHTPAEVVDHVIPHKGNQELFWDIDNWQSLCIVCHNRKTAKEKAA